MAFPLPVWPESNVGMPVPGGQCDPQCFLGARETIASPGRGVVMPLLLFCFQKCVVWVKKAGESFRLCKNKSNFGHA